MDSNTASYPEVVPSNGPIHLPRTDAFQQPGAKEEYAYRAYTPTPGSKPTNYARWLLIVGVGLVIAVIAGLAGGFIGKSIESSRHKNSSAAAPAAAATSATVSSDVPQSTTKATGSNATTVVATTTKTLNVQPTATGSLDIPSTGCSGNGNITGQTNYNVSYTLICHMDWPGNDIMGLTSGNMYDCVNTCYLWNEYGVKRPECIASAFVPDWYDESLAIEEVGYPMNCFLKAASNPTTPSAAREKVILFLN